MSWFRWEYLGVLLVIALIVTLYFVAVSAFRIWARMLGNLRHYESAEDEKKATRFILEPKMQKEVKKGLFWLFVLISILTTFANFRI